MAAVLALLSALAYGAGDFLGGIASKRLPAPAVVLRTGAVGLVGLLVAAPLVGADAIPARDLVVAGAGGMAGGLGILLLYRGLASGTMSVFAPITAVLSALVPIGAGLLGGEEPSTVSLVGVPVALVAVGLLSREPRRGEVGPRISAPVLLGALGAGLGFGLFFTALDATSDDSGLWPVVSGRAASVAMFSVLALLSLTARPAPADLAHRPTRAAIAGSGLLDAGANAAFLLATQRGLLTLVAVLGALYPAATLALARVVLGERLVGLQRLGLVLAAVAVVLVTAG